MTSALVAFAHHLAAFTLVSALVLVKVYLRDAIAARAAGAFDAGIARKLIRVDMIAGISAGLLLLIGLARVFVFEKGSGYYFHSVPFTLKLSLFIAVGLLSIVPTIEFVKWGKALKAGQPIAVSAEKLATLRKVVLVENAGAVGIILCAALVAKGIGVVG